MKEEAMTINVPKDDLVALGARFRADFLVAQAGYTLGLAAQEGEPLLDLLPEGFLGEAQSALAKVSAAKQDKALMAQEAKDATKKHNSAVSQAKVWRRRVVNRAVRGRRFGQAMPDALLSVGRAGKLPELVGQVDEMAKLLEENLALMPGKGAKELLEEVKAIAQALKSGDAEQELKRLKALPSTVRNFYEQKGLLYTALKAINDAGHELWADDSEASGRYNLSILHRRAGKRAAGEAPAAPGQG
jgi:hypothetical protein